MLLLFLCLFWNEWFSWASFTISSWQGWDLLDGFLSSLVHSAPFFWYGRNAVSFFPLFLWLSTFFFLLRHNWHIILHQFQVYNIMIRCCVYCEMITIISLVSIQHHTVTKFFFLMMGTFKIYSLSSFQIFRTVLAIVTTLYVTVCYIPWFIYYITESLYILMLSPIL